MSLIKSSPSNPPAAKKDLFDETFSLSLSFYISPASHGAIGFKVEGDSINSIRTVPSFLHNVDKNKKFKS